MGEAPVSLRADQYKKLQDGQVHDIYVNKYGDVCLSRLDDRLDTTTCAVFATTFWSPVSVDGEGYPIFQGVRGVRAKLYMSLPITVPRSSLGRRFRRNLCSPSTQPISQVMSLRLRKYEQLADLERDGWTSWENNHFESKQTFATSFKCVLRGMQSALSRLLFVGSKGIEGSMDIDAVTEIKERKDTKLLEDQLRREIKELSHLLRAY